MAERFADIESVARQLLGAGYLADDAITDAVFLADRLDKPVLVEGPAGVGKTSLATAVAAVTGARLLRLQCYEGLDEAKALYEWNYRKQLLRIQATGDQAWDRAQADIFGEDFLLERPLLAAIRAADPVVLLIDEVDRVEAETEALLLEVLAEFQVSIPELGTMTARQRPLVFLTSNGTRELSEALKRRCLFLHVVYPEPAREEEIIRLHVPDLGAELGAQVARLVHRIRELDLRKRPSISETIDWARTLRVLGVDDLRETVVNRTIPVLLKHQADIELARDKLGLAAATGAAATGKGGAA
jgi:MoxR-like ATPase